MAGQGAQVAVFGDELAAAENLGGGDRRPLDVRLLRQQVGDDVLAFLRFERTAAIDQGTARFGQGDGAIDQSALQGGKLGNVRGLLKPGHVGVAADGAGRGTGRIEEDGVERLGLPFGDVGADELGRER